MFFPNGVILSPNEDFLVVAETGSMSLIKYYLKGEKSGKSEIFIDALPGLPDNLTPDAEGMWVPLVISADSDHPNGFAIFSEFPLIRVFLTRILSIIESVFQYVNGIYPNSVSQRFVHFIGHGESFKIFSPKRSTVIRLDWNGNIVGSLHGYDGSSGAISHVLPYKDDLLLGSPFNHFLARVKSPSPTKPSRVRISNVRQSGMELDSTKPNEQKSNTPSTPKPDAQFESKQSGTENKGVKLEQNKIKTPPPKEPKSSSSERTEKVSPQRPAKPPAPVKEEIKVDRKPPKPEKLKIINKEGKHVEL